ncbi:aliphatic sulfonate ABC transporter substrate-binding protein [Streptomyces sp. NPDC001393]
MTAILHISRFRRLMGVWLAGAALLGLAGCGYGSKAAPGTAADALAGSGSGPGSSTRLSASNVKIAYFANLTHVTPLVGLHDGLFQKDLGGTKVEPQVFNAGPSEIEALNAGAVDIGWIGPSPAINGYVRSGGRSLRIISGSVSGGAELVVDPSKIKSVADLKGKKIATPQLGNTQDVALLNFLASKRFKENASSGAGDVSVIRSDNALTPQEFRSGQIDGAWVAEPTAAKLVAEGGKVLVDEASLWPGGRFVTTNVIVSQTFLKAHPDVVEAVLKASMDTNAWINSHPDRAKADANAALTALSGKPLPAKVLNLAWSHITVTDDPLTATLRQEAQHAQTAGFLKQPDLTGIYDLSLLDKVLTAAGRSPVEEPEER